MKVTISRLYDNYASAERAVARLHEAGVPFDDISVVSNNSDNWYRADHDHNRNGKDDRAEGAATGASVGAGLGVGTGLAAGLGLLAIPGLGPVVAAGWLAAAAAVAAAGAVAGGIIGALTEAGVSREDAAVYAEGVRRGGTLVSARVADADRARLEAVLAESSVNIRDRSEAWRQAGWEDFDSAGQAYGADEVRRERDLYIKQD